jgi:hypothetical protein
MPKIIKKAARDLVEHAGKSPVSLSVETAQLRLKGTMIKGVFDVGSEALSLAKEILKVKGAQEKTRQVQIDAQVRIEEAEKRLEEARMKYTVLMQGKLNEKQALDIITRQADQLLDLLEDLRPLVLCNRERLDEYLRIHGQLLQGLAALPRRTG